MFLEDPKTESNVIRIIELKFMLINYLMEKVFAKYSVYDFAKEENFEIIANDIRELVSVAVTKLYKPLAPQRDQIAHSIIKNIFGDSLYGKFIDEQAVSDREANAIDSSKTLVSIKKAV